MRLDALAKMGFYPANSIAIDALASHLRLSRKPRTSDYSFNIIDPCAGEGAALAQLAAQLGIKGDGVHAIELDPDRTDAIRERLPVANVIGPASFMGCKVTAQSFGFVYVNPPFDNELGAKERCEETFLYYATRILTVGGIIAFIGPFSILNKTTFVNTFDASYERVSLYKFPDGNDPLTGQPIRKYNEIVILAQRRKETLSSEAISNFGELNRLDFPHSRLHLDALPAIGTVQPHHYDFDDIYQYQPPVPIGTEPAIRTFEIPPTWKPSLFAKFRMTDAEITREFSVSPLNRLFSESAPAPVQRPPLPLNNGHLGMLLASGMLDGTIPAPNGPHVVRGGSHKQEYKASTDLIEDEENEKLRIKETYSETIVTTIRMIDADGRIYTHSNGEPPADASDLAFESSGDADDE